MIDNYVWYYNWYFYIRIRNCSRIWMNVCLGTTVVEAFFR